MDMVTEEDPGCIRADVHIPLAFSKKESEPEVSLVLDLFASCYVRARACFTV